MRPSVSRFTATHRRSVVGAPQINLHSAKRYRSLQGQKLAHAACSELLGRVCDEYRTNLLGDRDAYLAVPLGLRGEVREHFGADRRGIG
jgi:hypothetical protein